MEEQLKLASGLARLLDNRFEIYGRKFGISAFINLVPELGDILDALLSLYIVYIALKIGVPSEGLTQMLWNILINFIVGSIPIIGDAIYLLRKVNLMNLEIIKKYADSDTIDGEEIFGKN